MWGEDWLKPPTWQGMCQGIEELRKELNMGRTVGQPLVARVWWASTRWWKRIWSKMRTLIDLLYCRGEIGLGGWCPGYPNFTPWARTGRILGGKGKAVWQQWNDKGDALFHKEECWFLPTKISAAILFIFSSENSIRDSCMGVCEERLLNRNTLDMCLYHNLKVLPEDKLLFCYFVSWRCPWTCGLARGWVSMYPKDLHGSVPRPSYTWPVANITPQWKRL